MKKHFFTYSLIRIVTAPIALLPYRAIHALGKKLGTCAYFLLTKFRKRAWSNLALATDLHLNQKQIRSLAKASFQNLMITCMEYPKLAVEKEIFRIATCENPQDADKIMQEGKGIIFFCGHQANWELLFLEGTSRMPGVAIGRPVKNQLLYNWILTIRQKFGGKIITPQHAIREGLRALKQHKFLGIVGDQGMPDSGFSCPFLGRKAWTSPIAAILAYRTGSPIIVATTRREKGKYVIHYSDPLWPNKDKSMEEETERLMKLSLSLLEESIKKYPGQWLWQHNRWKQQLPGKLKRLFRQDSLCIILPKEKTKFKWISEHLHTLRALYPHELITLFVPKSLQDNPLSIDAEKIIYERQRDLLINDYRFKLVFDFTDNQKVQKHYLSLSAFSVLTLSELERLSLLEDSDDLSEIFKRALCNAP